MFAFNNVKESQRANQLGAVSMPNVGVKLPRPELFLKSRLLMLYV